MRVTIGFSGCSHHVDDPLERFMATQCDQRVSKERTWVYGWYMGQVNGRLYLDNLLWPYTVTGRHSATVKIIGSPIKRDSLYLRDRFLSKDDTTFGVSDAICNDNLRAKLPHPAHAAFLGVQVPSGVDTFFDTPDQEVDTMSPGNSCKDVSFAISDEYDHDDCNMAGSAIAAPPMRSGSQFSLQILNVMAALGCSKLAAGATRRSLWAFLVAFINIVLSVFAFAICAGALNWSIGEQQSQHKSTRYGTGNVSTKCYQGLKLHMRWRRWYRALCTIVPLLFVTAEAEDLRPLIIDGVKPCFRYIPERKLFQMRCITLHWKTLGYGAATYISLLSANETFDGDLSNHLSSIVDMSAISDFQGLFRINNDGLSTFAEAPLIKNVHVRNGTTAENGGFIVQKEQKYLKIDLCSSTGSISKFAGGICGYRSGFNNGEIKVSNSYSTGTILGQHAGGITGADVGSNSGIVHVAESYSTGNIEAGNAGDICGFGAGFSSGQVYVTHCYSTGDIVSGADGGGGVVGYAAGFQRGYVSIQACYSTGGMLSRWSGGIAGGYAGMDDGIVHITDCYSRADIHGQFSGGITGSSTGGCCGLSNFGNVHINNTYASGFIQNDNGGGIVGSISQDLQYAVQVVRVQYSVFNNYTDGAKIIGYDPGNNLDEIGDSNNLDDIRGRLYHYEGMLRWDNHTWAINGSDGLPILRFPEATPSPTPSSISTCTPTRSTTTSTSATPSPTWTTTSSRTRRPTQTTTGTVTSSRTRTPTSTRTATRSATKAQLQVRRRPEPVLGRPLRHLVLRVVQRVLRQIRRHHLALPRRPGRTLLPPPRVLWHLDHLHQAVLLRQRQAQHPRQRSRNLHLH